MATGSFVPVPDGPVGPLRQMTEEEAFNAMRMLLERYWRDSPELPLTTIVSGLDSVEYGYTSDPACFHEWRECVQTVLGQRAEAAE